MSIAQPLQFYRSSLILLSTHNCRWDSNGYLYCHWHYFKLLITDAWNGQSSSHESWCLMWLIKIRNSSFSFLYPLLCFWFGSRTNLKREIILFLLCCESDNLFLFVIGQKRKSDMNFLSFSLFWCCNKRHSRQQKNHSCPSFLN